jgi:hypothetical protein
MMQRRDEIARRYGFTSFAELLDVSDPLPMMPGETARSYVARDGRGYWFVWEDVPSAPSGETPTPILPH